MKMDFMVPGISKCGTTTLCHQLGEHPQIFLPPEKEPHHFIRSDMSSDEAAYKSLFATARPGQLLGEGSQMYASQGYEELVSLRLQQHNPQMKLIFCARNPLTRIESSYREFHHSGAKYAVNAPFGIANALRELPALLQDSHYWQRLQPFRQRFGDGQILIVLLEDLQRDAQHELARCYRFLGVDATFQNPSAGTRLNSQEEKRYDVSVQPSHLPNSSIKGDGVRVFLSGRDSPYRRDFHAPTKLLPQTVQGPGCSGVPATRCERIQRCHPPRHQCQRHSQVATALSRSTASCVAGVRSSEGYA